MMVLSTAFAHLTIPSLPSFSLSSSSSAFCRHRPLVQRHTSTYVRPRSSPVPHITASSGDGQDDTDNSAPNSTSTTNSPRIVRLTETIPRPLISFPWSSVSRELTYDLSPSSSSASPSSSGHKRPSISSSSPSSKPASSSLPSVLLRIAQPLLPSGYPDTVGPTYCGWVFWHIGRHVFRNAYYVLGTTSLLVSLGVGKSEAVAVSAALKWVLKDGVAMGTKLIISTNLARFVDVAPKRYRILGDFLMTQSVLVEILSLTHPRLFIVFGSIAALLKDAGGAMSGPAYRVFLDAFAIGRNIGDVSSRGEAQVVVGNLIGLSLGVVITSVLNQFNFSLNERLAPTLLTWAALSSAHMLCTAKAVASTQLNTLTLQRLDAVLSHAEQTAFASVPSVKEVNLSERFVRPWTPSNVMQRVVIGASLSRFVSDQDARCRLIQKAVRNNKRVIVYNAEDGRVGVILREDASTKDILHGVVQARHFLYKMDSDNGKDNEKVDAQLQIVRSEKWATDRIDELMGRLGDAEWSTEKLLLRSLGGRFRISDADAPGGR